VGEAYLHDCEPAVLEMYRGRQTELLRNGAQIRVFEPDFWSDSREIFGGIQAHEAAAVHRGYYEHFEPTIRDRLAWGASLSAATIEDLRKRHVVFRGLMDQLLAQHDFLMLPCAPMSTLRVGADHSETRLKILRYTTPVSLAGMPAVTLAVGCGAGQRRAAARVRRQPGRENCSPAMRARMLRCNA
jgi:Asp-tRNA(Asn)/Glu-tRNA(Gln) amidotransferase A subunit family amidase